ncbi:ABC transporter permease [Rathayibacter rathayi]|uniref:ABC transporter permease n=1 Tax=Rathayibacter rathayi TaxID=33887 RepID=A0ABD6WBS1_RATRA|nr:ABC transporter permease subunit [Rathayibacter rathayi]AZZ48434.1 ABC transporter permease [Rathayibacter rathayi]MWV74344.1 ABC transporter permease subunit [Rathayibacter rathayi NCPPB 2980 = VKM Ac-1601]PPF15918.1 ABC transporter permease [Rathayibacter rathayi]PPF22760.1 ABC transporter permease [Rathayibacter rathayi]PPF47630.1 ABC transporter permease [Rathayibacter rathayi]
MNRRRVTALVQKDFREILRNKQALAPIIVVPILVVTVLPVLVLLLGRNQTLMASINGMQQFLANLPAGIVPADYDLAQSTAYAMVIYFFAPIFLLIPVMVASVTASASFVGEKEKRTIEGLLYTPLTNSELVLAKILVSLIPAVLVTWAAFLLYGLVVNLVGYPLFGGLVFPTATWLVSAFVLAPLIAFLAICLIVAVSQRATTVQGAQGTAAFLVLPLVGLVVAQTAGLSLFNLAVAGVGAVVLVLVDLALFFAVVRRFDRERLVTRL